MRYRVDGTDGLQNGEAILVRAGGVEVGLFRVGDEWRAYQNRCRHQGGPVCRGDVVPRFVEELGPGGTSPGVREVSECLDIVCPWHGWEYDLRTGEHIGDPRIALTRFPVTLEGDAVYVDVPE